MNEMKKVILTMAVVVFSTSCIAQSSSATSPDLNQDGVVGMNDLLILLTAFGDFDVDFDGVWDSVDLCVDTLACNYDNNPTSACEYLDALAVCGGNCASDINGDGECDEFYGSCEGEVSLFYNGYNYNLVSIDNRCWLAQNLRSSTFSNGDSIPFISESEDWVSLDSAGYTLPILNNSEWIESYGSLYNGFAVIDNRGLCPAGWSIPSINELSSLIALEGAAAIRASEFDSPAWNGTNSTGFSAVPAGWIDNSGVQYGLLGWSIIWASDVTEYDWPPTILLDNVWLDSSNYISYDAQSFSYGMSVRCIKDTE
ncbi:MAG TPA: hypothetical protein DCX00_07655 [Flavobacteriales bacterium]|nr:hypothetical protein [Flavobacteriales bacterium]